MKQVARCPPQCAIPGGFAFADAMHVEHRAEHAKVEPATPGDQSAVDVAGRAQTPARFSQSATAVLPAQISPGMGVFLAHEDP